MMRRLLWLAVVAIAALIAATGCGGGDGEEPTATPTGTSVPDSSPTPTVAATEEPVGDEPAPSVFTDLAEADPLFTFFMGDAEDVMPGLSALVPGDFNDDGVGDLLIGARFADGPDNSREDAGEAYVVFGRSDPPADVDLVPESVDLTIYGALPGDTLGFAVAAGDLNDDGIDDIIVGAPASNGLENVRTDLGEAYIIFGSRDLGGVIDTAEVEQDVTIRAAEGFARLGSTFGIGDVNGDGRNDLVAGAPFGGREPGTPPGGPRTSEGEVYVVFGSKDWDDLTDVAADQQDFTLAGADEYDAFGQAVTVADVNDDGIDDMIVGARGADGPDNSRVDAGEVFVFFGSKKLSGKYRTDQADFTLLGADEGDRLGETLISGDFNGDDIPDVLIAAPAADGPRDDREGAGEARIIYGSRSFGGPVVDLLSDEPDVTIYGRGPIDMLSTGMAVWDLDGDGLDDVVLGEPLASSRDNARVSAGEAYVLFADLLKREMDLHTDIEGVLVYYGAEDFDGLGSAVALTDLDDDGELELALLAPGAAGVGERAGKIYFLPLPER